MKNRILRMAETETTVGLKETQIRQKVAEGTFPKWVKLSASGRAIGFLEHEIEEYLDQRIAERERGYIPSPAEVARIRGSREGRRRAKAARAADQVKSSRHKMRRMRDENP